jgi:L-threonylcarbamoyladenylate synthase
VSHIRTRHQAHLHSQEQLVELVIEIPLLAQKLMQSFWPGPLTLIFKKSKKVSDLVTANLNSVAIRIPKNDIALKLLKEVGAPVAAPSANKFQSMSPTTAQAVESELGSTVTILDGGLCEKGLESTVVSLVGEPEVLRFGAVPVEDLEMVLGNKISVRTKAALETANQVAPGLLSFHYAPKTKLVFCEDLNEAEEHLKNKDAIALVFDNKLEQQINIETWVLSKSGKLEEAAQNLFKTLREIDSKSPSQIIAIAVPNEGLGRAINDRLKKAQHK